MGDGVLDDFRAGDDEPLTRRWEHAPLEAVFVKPDAPLPEGYYVRFDKEWMVEGGTYGVVIRDGVEEWWEKVDGYWTRRP